MRSYLTAMPREIRTPSYTDLVKDLTTGWRVANLRGFELADLKLSHIPTVEAFVAELDKIDERGREYLAKYKRAPRETGRVLLELRAYNKEWATINAAAIERSNKREAREKAKWAAEHAAELAAMSPAELKKYRETPT
jgi:hypothetical protein